MTTTDTPLEPGFRLDVAALRARASSARLAGQHMDPTEGHGVVDVACLGAIARLVDDAVTAASEIEALRGKLTAARDAQDRALERARDELASALARVEVLTAVARAAGLPTTLPELAAAALRAPRLPGADGRPPQPSSGDGDRAPAAGGGAPAQPWAVRGGIRYGAVSYAPPPIPGVTQTNEPTAGQG